MKKINKLMLPILICTILFYASPFISASTVMADTIQFVILSHYKLTLNIGEEQYLLAITTNGAMPSWKSSSSAIASVNTYGKITAKKAGTATITAKIKNSEASCKVTVSKTSLSISASSVTLERGDTRRLSAKSSTVNPVRWKSSKKSVATIDEDGWITAVKPGETTITATADGTIKNCKVTVKAPTLTLNKSKLRLTRNQTMRLVVSVSSGITPVFKTNKKSVATVDETGTITAMKHGTAIITATVDGVSRSCEVTVESPSIKLSQTELHLKTGATAKLSAQVSSGNPVHWSTSNDKIVTISSDGTITAWQKGRAYLYASEDGTKVKCIVTVTDPES